MLCPHLGCWVRLLTTHSLYPSQLISDRLSSSVACTRSSFEPLLYSSTATVRSICMSRITHVFVYTCLWRHVGIYSSTTSQILKKSALHSRVLAFSPAHPTSLQAAWHTKWARLDLHPPVSVAMSADMSGPSLATNSHCARVSTVINRSI